MNYTNNFRNSILVYPS